MPNFPLGERGAQSAAGGLSVKLKYGTVKAVIFISSRVSKSGMLATNKRYGEWFTDVHAGRIIIIRVQRVRVTLIVMSIGMAVAQMSSKRSVYGSVVMILGFCSTQQDCAQSARSESIDYAFYYQYI